MSYEDKYDAMCDYNAEQQSEGYSEAVADIYRRVENDKREIYTQREVLELIEEFE